MLLFMLVLLLCLAGAWFDFFNKRHVPDIIPASIWGLLVLNGSGYELVVICFTILFFLNAIICSFRKTPMFGWSDILAIPPVIVFAGLLPLGVGYLAFIILYVVWAVKANLKDKMLSKKNLLKYEVPIYVVLFFGMLVSIILNAWYT